MSFRISESVTSREPIGVHPEAELEVQLDTEGNMKTALPTVQHSTYLSSLSLATSSNLFLSQHESLVDQVGHGGPWWASSFRLLPLAFPRLLAASTASFSSLRDTSSGDDAGEAGFRHDAFNGFNDPAHVASKSPCTSLIRHPFQGIINLYFDFDVFSWGCCIGFRSMPCTCPISSAALFAKILDKGKTAFYSCLPTSTKFNLQSHREFSHAANQSHHIPTFSLLSQVPHNKSRVALPKSISSAFSRQTI